MTLSSATVWEVRSLGADTNGGGFVAGATGTDYSQQTTAQIAFTDLVIGATNTQLTSSANPFTSAHVGNIIQIASGTGFTVGFFQVVSVASTTATMDRAVGTASSTGGVGKLGGALATFSKLSSAMVLSNMAFIKADGTYTTGTTLSFAQAVTPTYAAMASRLRGYTTTRGDGGQSTLQITANSVTGLSFTNGGWDIENITVDCNSKTGSIGFSSGGNFWVNYYNCKAKNYGTYGFFQSTTGGQATTYFCEVSGGLSAATAGIALGIQSAVTNCYVHDSAGGAGILTFNYCTITDNIIANMAGATADGILNGYGTTILNNIIYNSGRHGINASVMYEIRDDIRGNILSKNGGYGIVLVNNPGSPARQYYDGNAFYSNTTGTRNNMDDTGSVNAINAVVPYTNTNDVTLSADPFVSASTGDFRLNTTAGGGAAARSAGLPKTWPGLSITAYPDMGAVQHQDAGGSTGGLLVHPGMAGGMRS